MRVFNQKEFTQDDSNNNSHHLNPNIVETRTMISDLWFLGLFFIIIGVLYTWLPIWEIIQAQFRHTNTPTPDIEAQNHIPHRPTTTAPIAFNHDPEAYELQTFSRNEDIGSLTDASYNLADENRRGCIKGQSMEHLP